MCTFLLKGVVAPMDGAAWPDVAGSIPDASGRDVRRGRETGGYRYRVKSVTSAREMRPVIE
ncbi:hypothetical protein BJF79_12940 [Actinomadura sp. CNU-125]|nr:hypothetical protein BJF79_12940 [Actinomadura sp. CNU-125]